MTQRLAKVYTVCWKCSTEAQVSGFTVADCFAALSDMGWREHDNLSWCPECWRSRLPSQTLDDRRRRTGHPNFGHRTRWLPDDSVWCDDCGGVVAVADG